MRAGSNYEVCRAKSHPHLQTHKPAPASGRKTGRRPAVIYSNRTQVPNYPYRLILKSPDRTKAPLPRRMFSHSSPHPVPVARFAIPFAGPASAPSSLRSYRRLKPALLRETPLPTSRFADGSSAHAGNLFRLPQPMPQRARNGLTGPLTRLPRHCRYIREIPINQMVH